MTEPEIVSALVAAQTVGEAHSLYSAWPEAIEHLKSAEHRLRATRDEAFHRLEIDDVAQRFGEYRERLNSRLPIINQVNREQVELLRRFRTAQDQRAREELKSALLLSINCIAAGLGITG